LALAWVLVGGAAEGVDWRVELLGGAASSFDSPLSLVQSGEPPLEIRADWSSRSFESPIYYAIRIGRFSRRSGFSLQLVHHKLYLENPPPEVQAFSVSHGYNLLTFDASWLAHGFELSAGGGLVVAHAETTVRQRTGPDGYHATGPTLALGVGRWLEVGAHFRVGADARFTASWAHVPIAGGEASVPDRAVHLRIGVGWRF
jgi:hypothetical protein